MRNPSNLLRGFVRPALLSAALMLAACSSKRTPSNSAVAKGAAGAKKAPRPAKELAAAPAPRSTFTLGADARDPFFPAAKKAAGPVAGKPEPKLDVLALLQEGFQGVISSGDQRIAVINNVMLETGRETVIPVGAGSQERSVPVKCRDVSRDAVLLEVQGYAQPVRISSLAAQY